MAGEDTPQQFPGATSAFGLEAENAALREELQKCRHKLSKQRRELKRLHKGYAMMLHAARLKQAESKLEVLTGVIRSDVSGNALHE